MELAAMEQLDSKPANTRNKRQSWGKIKQFAKSLRREFAAEIPQNPGSFRGRVLGRLKAFLPRRGQVGTEARWSKKPQNFNLYSAKGLPGNWHELAKRLVPDYASLSVEMQRYHRFRLRSQTHSYLYDQRSRLRRSRGH